jgi:hypothetical protein
MDLGSAQPQTETSTRNLPGVKRRAAHKADSLSAICEPIVVMSSHCGPTRPVTRMAVYLPWKRHIMSSFLRPLLESETCSMLNQKMVCSLESRRREEIFPSRVKGTD